jgi:hypothetical protein
MPVNTVKVDRTTKFGNPFPAERHGRSGAVRMYELWMEWKLPVGAYQDSHMAMLMAQRRMVLDALPSLEGKNLACWCPLPAPGEPDICHAAVLLRLVRQADKPKGRT